MGKLNLNALKGKVDAASQSDKGNESVSAGGSDKPAAGLAFLKNRAKPAELQGQQEAAPTPPATGSVGGLAFLKRATQSGGAGGNAGAKPVAGDTGNAAKSDSSGVADNGGREDARADGDSGRDSGAGDLDLAGLLDSSTGGSAPVKSRFADEIPATAPVRELPEGLVEKQKQFIESLDSVYSILHEPDLLGGVIKNIMMELGQNPEYRKLITPQDVHVMIKGMRDSMGMARIKKEESKAKRSGGRKKAVQIDGVDDLLNSLGGDFD